MAYKTPMPFPKAMIEQMTQLLEHKYAAYNVTFKNMHSGQEETVQGNFHDSVTDFLTWCKEMIDEIEWTPSKEALVLHRDVEIINVEFDHYLANEGIEDKQNPSPDWKELPMVTIYVPAKGQIVQICEGDGSNLSDDDKEQGLVDYIYYTQYNIDNITEECDGGQIDQSEYLRDKYDSLVEVIPEVLEFAYDNANLEYILLEHPAQES